MNTVLLLGAGFSRNWGGWLANEAFEYLLGCPQIDADIRNLLWQHRRSGGFEAALADLQEDYLRRQDTLTEQRLKKLQDPILAMFADMDKAFSRVRFEFQNEIQYSVRDFLVRFDAIFSLNQDLLLERHYIANGGPSGRWSGTSISGMKAALGGGMGVDVYTGQWVPDPAGPTVQGGLQPFFKLHGSSNWGDGIGNQLLVMGGNKSSIIERYPILKWTQDRFKEYLTRPDTRLLVIGYSFGDPHVNRSITDASSHGTLKVFVIDPLGLDIIDENRRAPMYKPGLLVTSLQDHVIGASRRPLREIFGSDRVEHAKVMRFFQ